MKFSLIEKINVLDPISFAKPTHINSSHPILSNLFPANFPHCANVPVSHQL